MIGGGPIGMLIALLAIHKRAEVIVSEISEKRLAIAESLGFKTVNPLEVDLVDHIKTVSDGRLADVVFEVSGSAAGVKVMTEIAGIRSRIVMVAIHGQPQKVDLFKFFWRELSLIGVRVYEPEDYEESIEIHRKWFTAPGNIDYFAVEPLDKIQTVFENIDNNPDHMKVLINCNEIS